MATFDLNQTYLTFDDVLLKPQYSTIKSRSEVDLSVELCKNFKLKSPIIPANMRDIFGQQMAEFVYQYGGLGWLHRFWNEEEQYQVLVNLKNKYGLDIFNHIGISVGIREENKKFLDSVSKLGVRTVCLDIAHLDNQYALQFLDWISHNHYHMLIAAGTIATKDAALRAWHAGADIVRVGLGNGSICLTRIESGVGTPQLSALMEVQQARDNFTKTNQKSVYIISDGGCRSAGDLSKALALSDLVLTGNMFAGSDQTPGEVIELNNKRYKRYDGSSTHRKVDNDRIEGVLAMKEYRGDATVLLKRMHDGIQSACSYQGAKNLKELQQKAVFIRTTQAGLIEGGAHDVVVLK